ncbi:MAG: type I DNA topoisomerase [Bacillota bacterium]|jgi:DNA topoisomerase-1
MKTLVVVESPTKAKTIEKILGKNYTVKSSMGHIRDLPKSDLGVNVEEGFVPKYITIRGKGNTIKSLKEEAKKTDRILLASDPDREGEAIAWHLQQYLKVQEEDCRIEFNEITDQAVKEAVKNPHPIDMDRVEAQQARRILDRLVGYKISPLLWKKVKKGLSAGRVQSVTVRLICDREDEIKAFVPEEYWTLLAELDTGKGILQAQLNKIDGKKANIHSQEEIDAIIAYLADKEYIVCALQTKEKKENPQPPFTTSSLQQVASRNISGMTAKKIMQIAQQLYEGINIGGQVVGLISYMRTDSVRISDAAQTAARSYIAERYGEEFIPAKPNVFKGKGKVQNAHEAIRPTSVERTPISLKQYLTPQQYKLYKLIWERFMASQTSSAIWDVTSVEVAAGNCLFRASGRSLRFAGFRQVYVESKAETDKEEEGVLAPVKNEQKLSLVALSPNQHFTQPPPRYTEASLVKTLEELGIGRPSTYAPIVDTILARGYVVKEEKQFFPTELGRVVVDLLKEYFTNIIDIDFTAEMENQLDMVEEGNLQWDAVLSQFYEHFAPTLANAEKLMEKINIAPEESGDICELCGKPMVYRMGKYGRFLACSGFPECRNTKPIIKPTDITCMACGGRIVQRKSRSGRVFFGCEKYPDCKYVSWDLPIAEACSLCGTQLSQKTFRGGKTQIVCPNKDCPGNQKESKKKDDVATKKAKAAKPKKSKRKDSTTSVAKKTRATKSNKTKQQAKE